MATTTGRKAAHNRMSHRLRPEILALALIAATPLWGFEVPAGATRVAQDETVAQARFPRTAASDSPPEMIEADGAITRRAWQTKGTSLTSFQLMDPLRSSLEADGFEAVFACADSVCGGFDFRFALDLLPPPDMFVDLGDFQYFLARDEGGHFVSAVTSRSRDTGFIHVTEVAADGAASITARTVNAPAAASVSTGALATDVLRGLETRGRVPLDDLAFETGASTLGAGPFASLEQLAAYLLAHPDARIVLVGHTDNVGALEANVALSERRASAVQQRLLEAHGVAPEQLSATGVGFLAPRVSNATTEGRETNRRVEAVLASTREN